MPREIRLRQIKWKVLILDNHVGYITWEEYLENQAMLESNASARADRHGSGQVIRQSNFHSILLLICLWHALQPLAQGADFENRRVDWELTPLGRLMPSIPEDDVTKLSRIKDKETILDLLQDPTRFALVHVALCRLYNPPGPNLATVSADQVDGNYFGLRARITYNETKRSITKEVSYPSVEKQLSRMSTLWETYLDSRLHLSSKFAGSVSSVTPVRPASRRHIGQSFAGQTADVTYTVKTKVPSNHRRR